jgi:flagellar secretion chaperone FliS
MFASALARNPTGTSSTGITNAYRQVGVETAAHTATPHQLVLMLFDGFRDAVAQARGAIAAGRVEDKGRAIARALRIVDEGLRAGLNLEGGGALAADLRSLYDYLMLRLTHANIHNDTAALEECTRLLEPVRSAWVAIGTQAEAHAH